MSEKNLFQKTILKQNTTGCPPVWFMRQAGRYHSHYQNLKKTYTFVDFCKNPEISVEAAMGPIRDFDFDAAILFSDILFPLEVMGMGLKYDEGPKLGWHLKDVKDLAKLKGGPDTGEALAHEMSYQSEALLGLRKALPAKKGLLGFVGGPLTLYCYAVEGSHAGELKDSHAGMKDGRFEGFCAKLVDLLAEDMAMQARSGIDTIAVLDTCAGEFDPETYKTQIVPVMKLLFEKFTAKCPNTPITYYSKGTNPKHWNALKGLPIACLGVDWKHDMAKVLTEYGSTYAIQGNVDPDWMLLPKEQLEPKLREYFKKIKALPESARQGWVAGLGHGVLQKTPEENVHLYVRVLREVFAK